MFNLILWTGFNLGASFMIVGVIAVCLPFLRNFLYAGTLWLAGGLLLFIPYIYEAYVIPTPVIVIVFLFSAAALWIDLKTNG